jgi:hypothetical protein
MDKITGDTPNTEIKIWPMENCRFAYTLGNSQPVRCTWISEQPLFYSDCDDIMEDDYLLDDPVLESLERDIADLREKTNAYDKISQGFVEPENYTQSLFRDDAASISKSYKSKKSTLPQLLETLQKSRLASQFISFAQLHNVSIRETSQIVDASYDRESQAVLVRADLEESTKALLIVRELRRMWQHRNGSGLHPLSVHPDYAVLINRAQQADLLVSMIRVGWELQLSGHKDVWSRIENSTLSDLGRGFAREAIADFRSINNGLAARATFESWFLSERCRKADRTLIQQMLADYQGYVFSDNVETSRLITLDVIKALGKMPFGQNYIEAVATQIIVDPVFTEVRDRSNANFLWFIKFERSFTEAEKEVAPQAAEKAVTAEIIAFPVRKRSAKNAEGKIAKEDDKAEIVEIRRPAGE